MIFILRIGPVFSGAFLLIFAGYVLFSRGDHDHVVLAQATGVGLAFFGVMVLLNMLRLIWRAFLAFFS
jgi:hypothetical protein